ncbi:MAG: putative Na+/H+ antiporter [Akkermansia sp.]
MLSIRIKRMLCCALLLPALCLLSAQEEEAVTEQTPAAEEEHAPAVPEGATVAEVKAAELAAAEGVTELTPEEKEEKLIEIARNPETAPLLTAQENVRVLRSEFDAKLATLEEQCGQLTFEQYNLFMRASKAMNVKELAAFIREHDGKSAAEVLEHIQFPPPNCPACAATLLKGHTHAQGGHNATPAWHPHWTDNEPQFSRFPIPLKTYADAEVGMSLWQKLVHRVQVDPFNLAASLIFLFAIIHTFLAPRFQRLAHTLEDAHRRKLREAKFSILHPEQRVPVSFASTMCHFLGEVEVVFGLWIIPFALVCQHYYSMDDFLRYIDHDTSFTEPLFVAVVMVIASSRPIYRLAENTLKFGAGMGGGTPAAWWLSVLCIAPLLGSFITEPAAMTLAAILLSKKFYQLKPSMALRYATIALLFVNVSVGGTLTHFAAPPIVMVAGKWNWDMLHMFTHFGWKAIVGIALSNAIYFFCFRKEFARLAEVQRVNSAYDTRVPNTWEDRQDIIPVWVYVVSILFLAWTVYFAHHPAIFIGGFLFFLGFTMATPQYQNAFSIKVPLLVAFFLAGLLIMGGVQGWWMQPVLQGLAELGSSITMGIASVLTAFNDNASVTFLSSTVPDLPESIKYAVVAGAVTGGGLTVIANAPNPAGQAILGKYFKGISALQLLLWALLPTLIMFCMFNFIQFGD